MAKLNSVSVSRRLPGKSSQQGVMLLEALIAILIFSMGILALVGLQSAMVKNTTDAKFRADASYVAEKKIALMWADPDNVVSYLKTTDVSDVLPEGQCTISLVSGQEYQVTVSWKQPGQPAHSYTAYATVAGG